MQEREKEQGQSLAPADPKSEPLIPVPVSTIVTQDDDPDEIFMKAVAEIDTQPLLKRKKFVVNRFMDVFQVLLCSSLIVGSMAGIIWQVITYPKTLVILYPVEKPARLTSILDVPTRTLAPITLTRSATTPTTGHGHQDARSATGILTFYNGQSNPQSIPIGSVFTGNDGVKVSTNTTIIVPAANLPAVGEAKVSATAILPGSRGNIAAFDIDVALSSDLKAENSAPFTSGRDARTYKAVTQPDIQQTTSTLQATIAQAMPLAFPVAKGESVYPTHCVTTTMPSNQPGEEASTVTVKVTQTCTAIAYNQDTLLQRATQVFTAQTKPGTHYSLIGGLTSTIVSVTPFTIQLTGSWVYVLSSDDEQSLAQAIQGDTPAQARKYLLSTGVISQASVPTTLPASMYIEFLVLVG